MKAIIMAGGEGTRLRPITARIPKPMVPVAGRPVLEHLIRLLKKNGVTEICLTLRYLPKIIQDYFGDGSALGVSLQSRVEDAPLGTAGGVRACADFIGDGDFLVASGDGLCDFDLRSCIRAHEEKQADATIVLCQRRAPLEYGVVVTEPDGKIRRFVEKPSWDRVYSDRVNTGIYLFSNRVLQEIPAGAVVDFGKDLFPALLKEGKNLYGVTASGYWCDIGNPEAYRRCCMDVLSGAVKLELPGKEIRPKVWSGTELSETGAVLIPPVLIGRDVVLGRNARIGPDVILGDGSRVGDGAAVRETAADGALIGENARISGAVLQKGVTVGNDTVVEDLAVLGEGTAVGRGCLVASGVQLQPDSEIPDGTRALKEPTGSGPRKTVRIESGGVLRGEFGGTATPQVCTAVGSALASLGPSAVGRSGDEAAAVLAGALECGARAAGGDVFRLDSDFEAQAEFAGCRLGAAVTAFVRQTGGESRISLYDGAGRPLSDALCRKLERALSGDPKYVPPERTGKAEEVAGMREVYLAEARDNAGAFDPGEIAVCMPGKGAENRALRSVLCGIGCVSAVRRRGTIVLQAEPGGFDVTGADERGAAVTAEQLKTLAAFAELSSGGTSVAAAEDGPTAVAGLCGSLGKTCVAPGESGRAAELLFRAQRFARDGIFAAARVIGYLLKTGEKLCELRRRVPAFSTAEREVAAEGGRAGLMRAISESTLRGDVAFGRGITVKTEKGTVTVTPCADREAVRIVGGSEKAEFARELCADLEKTAKRLGSGQNPAEKSGE